MEDRRRLIPQPRRLGLLAVNATEPEFLDWPDYGVPDDPALIVTALESLLDRARAGEHVEIGCYGGHGRTGTALACLAILCGQAPQQAISWVRAQYCERAVETDEQEAFVRNLAR